MSQVGWLYGWAAGGNVEDRLAAVEEATPYPQLSMDLVDPLPAGMSPAVIGAGVKVDLDIWALKIDDRANVKLLPVGSNTYMQVTDMFNDPEVTTIRMLAGLSLEGEDVSGASANVRWTIEAISGIDLGTGSEVILEDTVFSDQTTGNKRSLKFGATELLELPSTPTPIEFGLRMSHDNGSNRDFQPAGLEVPFMVQDKS